MDTTFSHIKAVFCDIDGTLLTSQHTVSPRTVAAIRALRERGVLFGLCTGRDAHATEAMYELWGIEGLVDVLVGCGGAEVIDRAHDINELSYPLPGETIARICKHMADLPATPVCPRDGVFYVPESNACVEHLSRVDGVPYQVVDFAEFLREPQPKVMFTMAPEVMPRVIERASTFAATLLRRRLCKPRSGSTSSWIRACPRRAALCAWQSSKTWSSRTSACLAMPITTPAWWPTPAWALPWQMAATPPVPPPIL